MSSSNTNVQITDLDFNSIKSNFITYLQNQDTFKDYNFQGSALSVLLDVLAYNTQYNAYYLNMVANEMFLDSALQRSSVVSQAKALGYVPASAVAPTAYINFTGRGITTSSFTIPKFSNFMSEAIGGVNYNFVTIDSTTVPVTSGIATITNLELKQGIPVNFNFTVNSTSNPTYTFEIPDPNIDTSTIQVLVQQSVSNTAYDVYTQTQNYLTLNGTSKVYFLQESINGNYQISFGNGVLGQQLSDGNIVKVSYVATDGSAATGANNFVYMNSSPNLGSYVITPQIAASQGKNKESVDSIKFQAPKSYAAQGRAVTKEDYISLLQQNNLGISFDAVNVWGGEENNPPIYGQVFMSLKPTGGYVLTETQKQRLIQNTIKPYSVLTVEPTIVDPDYTYLQITCNVLYDPKKTTLNAGSIQNVVANAINNFALSTLNTFNSTFKSSDLVNIIQNSNQSIITNEISVKVQKKFYPKLGSANSYKLYYGVPLQQGTFLSGIYNTPSFSYNDPTGTISDVYIQEIPSSTSGIQSISVINPGYGYQTPPTVTINGDGSGATATAVLNGNGSIKEIVVVTPGSGYTTAFVTITNASNDTTGALGAGIVNLIGQFGTLELYYNNPNIASTKVILNNNIGSIDYTNGVVYLNAFNPVNVNNPLGELTITGTPTTSIISSSYNRIVTVDQFDPTAIIVNVTAKTS